MITVPLLLTEPHECSYLNDRLAQDVFVHPVFSPNNQIYAGLIAKGFRRSGDELYAPRCPQCQACLAARIVVNDFRPDRRQRRCWRKNRDVITIVKPAQFEPEHFSLYQKYQLFKHPGGSMADMDEDDYMQFLGSHWCATKFVEFRQQDQLMAVAVVDYLETALSAVYTFFDPDLARYSPGTYAVLWQVEYAKRLGMDYVYLGFWIKDCQKMQYKAQFKPLEVYQNQNWRLLKETEDGC